MQVMRSRSGKPPLTLSALIVCWNEGRSAFWMAREYRHSRAYAIGMAFRAGLKERDLPPEQDEQSEDERERPVWRPGVDPLPRKFALSMQMGLRT